MSADVMCLRSEGLCSCWLLPVISKSVLAPLEHVAELLHRRSTNEHMVLLLAGRDCLLLILDAIHSYHQDFRNVSRNRRNWQKLRKGTQCAFEGVAKFLEWQ